MLAFLSRRFRRWALIAIALPVLAWLLERAGMAVERRRPNSRAGRALRHTGGLLRPRRGGRGEREDVGW
jgi:hypothetical protein